VHGHFGRLINVRKVLEKVTELIKNIRHPPKKTASSKIIFSVIAETEQRKFDQRIV
jgi:hypothetical protein